MPAMRAELEAHRRCHALIDKAAMEGPVAERACGARARSSLASGPIRAWRRKVGARWAKTQSGSGLARWRNDQTVSFYEVAGPGPLPRTRLTPLISCAGVKGLVM